MEMEPSMMPKKIAGAEQERRMIRAKRSKGG
jgi:hypothetical protein